MNRRHLILACGLLGALGLVIFGDRTPPGEPMSGEVVEAAPRRAPVASTNRAPAAVAPEVLLELQPRQQLIGRDASARRPGLFAAHSWMAAPLLAETPVGQAEPGIPPLPFTYVGKQQLGKQWKVFLANGNNIYIVGTGDVFADQYKAVAISPPTMTIEYLPMHQEQSLLIE